MPHAHSIRWHTLCLLQKLPLSHGVVEQSHGALVVVSGLAKVTPEMTVGALVGNVSRSLLHAVDIGLCRWYTDAHASISVPIDNAMIAAIAADGPPIVPTLWLRLHALAHVLLVPTRVSFGNNQLLCRYTHLLWLVAVGRAGTHILRHVHAPFFSVGW